MASERELRVEGGQAPAAAADDRVQLHEDDPAPLLEQAATQLVEWEVDVVGDLLVIPFVPLWYAARRGGAPPGAFIPDDIERANMARPATRMLNRSERLRRFATAGDPIAFALAVATFVRHEAEEVDEWRAAHGLVAVTEQPPDNDVADVGVRPVSTPPPPTAGVRSWRPPVVEPEPPA